MAWQRWRHQGGAADGGGRGGRGGRGGPSFGFYKRFDGLAGSQVMRAELFPAAGDVNATASGFALSYAYSFQGGQASGGGAVDGTGTGFTLTVTYSFAGGQATASSQALGGVWTEGYSFQGGSARASSQAAGANWTESFSFAGGAAQASAQANGANWGVTYSFQGGTAAGEAGATATGAAWTYAYAFSGGMASAENEQSPVTGGGAYTYSHGKERRKRVKILDDILQASIEAEKAIQDALESPTKENKRDAIKSVAKLDLISPDFKIPAAMQRFTPATKTAKPLIAAALAVDRTLEQARAQKRKRQMRQGMMLLLLAA